MKTKKFLNVLAVLVLLLAAVPVLNVGAGGAKVDVCHSEGNGTYHIINISENAFDTHVAHGDASPGDSVPGMEEGYYFTDTCEVEFVRHAEITSPETEGKFFVGDSVTFAATLWDKDKDDNVQWAVRKGTCAAGTNTVFGNVDGYNNSFSWDGMYFSSTANTTGWDSGEYCFIFNPTESAGDASIRETRLFTLISAVEGDVYLNVEYRYGNTSHSDDQIRHVIFEVNSDGTGTLDWYQTDGTNNYYHHVNVDTLTITGNVAEFSGITYDSNAGHTGDRLYVKVWDDSPDFYENWWISSDVWGYSVDSGDIVVVH